MIDLHTHSTASDGSLTPTELIGLARTKGLTALALTDHDTVDGLDEASRAAEQAGIVFVPGIEIEVDFPPGEFHLLGLGLRDWKGDFTGRLFTLKEHRRERNRKILRNMREAGIEATYDELEQIAGGGTIGRPHIARLLVMKGAAKTVNDAFRKFIGKGMKFYEPREALILEEATKILHEAGGKAIVAHPLSLYISLAKLPEILSKWIEYGIDGIEAYHSNASRRECERLAGIADDLGLIKTAGSDFHGDHRPERKLGRTTDGMEIADSYLAPFSDPH